MPERLQGFRCPFELDLCGEHSLADCGLDVTLAKVLAVFEAGLLGQPQQQQQQQQRQPPLAEGKPPLQQEQPAGRLRFMYGLARTGQLRYDDDDPTDGAEACTAEEGADDDALLRRIRDQVCVELECQICFGLLLDPATTHCGHTFCRKCLQRVMDHSHHCPSCRRTLQLPSSALLSLAPNKSRSNRRLCEILVAICPDALTQRALTAPLDDGDGDDDDDDDGLQTPIFVCTASFPSMPTPLFIFEPRYQLMIRRVWQDGRRFGMVLPNRTGQAQGELGVVPFMQYGTLLRIENVRVYPDGRSHIWTVGTSKFKIVRWGYRDDYIVANTERRDDIPIADEEAIEAAQTAGAGVPAAFGGAAWTSLPTQELLHLCHRFVDHMRAVSMPWLREDNLATFGPRPDDAAVFPYWFASVLPIVDREKYRLICSRSVRERLLLTMWWIKLIESHRWWVDRAAPATAVCVAS